jgi:multiple sugar transport system substrate-binding protein
MKRLIQLAVLAAAALILSVGAAAAKPTATGSSKTVTVSYFTFSAAPDHLNSLNALIQIFEKQHPNIQISYTTAPYADYFTKLQTEIAGGTAPDAFELDYGNFYGYAHSGSLYNLSKLAKADKTFKASVYYPRAYSSFAVGKTQYGLPESFSDVLLFYNADLFKAAHVPLPTYKVLAQNGGSFFNAAKTKATFDSPAGIAAANWLLSKPGTVMPTDEEMGGLDDTTMFKLGKLAMWHNGIWQFSGLSDVPFHWNVVVEPAGKVKANHFFANTVAINAHSPNAQAAWQWLKFLSASHASVNARVKSGWELAPVKDKTAFSAYLAQRPPANRQAVLDALANPVLTPTIAQGEQQMQDDVGNALQKAELGQVSVATALHQAAAQVTQLLASGG